MRRAIRKLLGLRGSARKSRRERPPEGAVFEHLWRAASAASAYPKQRSIRQPNVLLFQMGKVASLALQHAMLSNGINCFHCHTLRYEEEAQRLSQVFVSRTDALAVRNLKLLSKHTALNMLVRWYQANEVSPGRKLKVITLTRDPVTRFVSHQLQRLGYNAQPLIDWHHQVTGGSSITADIREAACAMFREVARLVIEARRSVDAASAQASGSALAKSLPRPQQFIAEAVGSALTPLDWFDQQFLPLFGVDILAAPEFRQSGLAHRDLGSIEVLVIRFEDIGRHMGAIAGHVGLASLDIPPRNVTADKPNASPILEASRIFLATELGKDFQREMRQTSYARACGYDAIAEL